MHAGEKRKLEKRLAAVNLDSAARVRTVVGEHFVADVVCEARGGVTRTWPLRVVLMRPPWRAFASSRWKSRTISEGSFCPSPSMVAIKGKRAARTPVLSAALCPALFWVP